MLFAQRRETNSISRNREVGIRYSVFGVSAESDAKTLARITGKARGNTAVTRTDITNYCREGCKIKVTRGGWIPSFHVIGRN
jgi:hypothetical protein